MEVVPQCTQKLYPGDWIIDLSQTHTSYLSFFVHQRIFWACKKYTKKVRKFATKNFEHRFDPPGIAKKGGA